MFKNYFYLLRSAYELNEHLGGQIITDIYSQEKNKLFFHIPSDEYPHKHLIISTNPQSPYLFIKLQHYKAKKNTVQFFSNYLPVNIQSIETCANDRVVRFNLEHFRIYYSIRGSKTNILFIDNKGQKLSFKKSEVDIIPELESQYYFTSYSNLPVAKDKMRYSDIMQLKKNYPMISGEIKNELILRSSSEDFIDLLNCFKEIITEILHAEIRIGFNSDLGKIVFVPLSFKSITTENSKIFGSFNSALQYYLSVFYKESSKSNYRKELSKYFNKELSSLSAKLNKLKRRIDEGSKEQMYYLYGNTLLSNIYQIKKGMSSIELNQLSDEIKLHIKLDPKLSPRQNIDKYFDKARDEKVNYNKSIELFNFTKGKYESLLEDFNLFEKAETTDEISDLYKKLIPNKKKILKMDSGHKFKYLHYILEDKYHLYVGRDSKSNDYLSIKFAKQNDYWFHARGLPGSHVVLRVDNVKEGVPKDIIKKGAAVAAYYSKAKTAGTAPVTYTLAKFVHKKKGMPPGKVLLSKENSILVKPGIPKNCELVSE